VPGIRGVGRSSVHPVDRLLHHARNCWRPGTFISNRNCLPHLQLAENCGLAGRTRGDLAGGGAFGLLTGPTDKISSASDNVKIWEAEPMVAPHTYLPQNYGELLCTGRRFCGRCLCRPLGRYRPRHGLLGIVIGALTMARLGFHLTQLIRTKPLAVGRCDPARRSAFFLGGSHCWWRGIFGWVLRLVQLLGSTKDSYRAKVAPYRHRGPVLWNLPSASSAVPSLCFYHTDSSLVIALQL